MRSYCTECGKDTSLCWGWDHFVNEMNAEVCGACVLRILNKKEVTMRVSYLLTQDKNTNDWCVWRKTGELRELVGSYGVKSTAEELLKELNKEVPQGDSFKARLAKCLDRYAGQGKYLVLRVDELWLALESWPIGIGIPVEKILRPNIQATMDTCLNREEQLDALVYWFEQWLNKRESETRIFTDESGKKYEIREVKE